MKREIKFRVWNESKKSFDYNPHVSWADVNPFNLNDWLIRCEITQYTGLKDLNGKEIYEGDIVYSVTDKRFYEIKFGEYDNQLSDNDLIIGNGWYIYSAKHSNDLYSSVNNLTALECRCLTVEGNIYENPKML